MKKITLWLFLLIGFISFSQINISQNFPTTTAPAGWSNGGGVLTTTQACATASWRMNIHSTSSTTTNALSTETFVSTGEPLNVSFDYKIVDWSAATVATTPYNGTIVVETSIDNGVTYGSGVVAVNNANHVVANTCATKTVVIPGSSAPSGSNTKIRFKCNFGTSGDYYVYLDNVIITQAAAPPCTGTPAPGNTIAPAAICFGSSANLTLQNYTPGSAITYQWYLNAVAIAGATSSNYTIPSVSNSNSYYCEVTCAGNTTASNPLSVGPTILNAPLLEPFSTFLPTCWTNMFGGDLTTGPTASTGSGWVADGFANSGTTGAIRNEIWITGANDWVISPVINIPAVGYELKFDAAATQFGSVNAPTNAWEADDYIEVLVATGGSTTNWIVAYTYNNMNQPSNNGSVNIIDLSAYAGQNIRVAFHAVEGATNGSADIDFSIDNFQVRLTPACSDPIAIVTGNIAFSSLDMSWTAPTAAPAVGYEYIVSTSNTVPVVNGTAVATTFASPTGLLSNTTYYIFVRSDCGSGIYSAWTGPVSFTTTCAPLSAPVLENFATFLPSVCWFNRTGGDLTTGPTTLTGSGWVADGFANAGTTGAVKNEIWITGANDWLISPQVTIPTVGYELKFDAAATQFASVNAPTNVWESDDYIEVLVSTTGLTNWTPVFTYNDGNQPSNTGTPNIIDLDAYAGQNIRIAFRAVEGATNGTADIDFSLDNFQVRLTPTCIEPLNLVSSGATSSSVNISWDATTPDPTTGYEYFVSTTNTVPVTAGTATTNTFAIPSGLLPQTTYYVFVRSDCSAGDFSSWSGPISFTTTCAPLSTPVLENFATFLPSVCWFNRTGGNLTTGPTTLTGSGWVADGFANAGTTGAVRNEIFTTGANDWFISPEIIIPAVGYELKFDAAATQFASVNAPTNVWESDDYIEVLVSTTGLTNWTPVFTYNDGNQPSNTGTPNIIDLDAYAGQNIRIAFRAVEGGTDGTADIDFSLDNFQVRLTPTCIEPLNLVSSSVTFTTANVSWDATTPDPTTGYEYFVSTTNTVPVTAGTATINTFAALSGLLPNTTYYIFVRSDCSAGDFSPWNGPISFYTGYCLPSSTGNATYVNNFTTTSGSQNISNLATGFTTGGYLNATSQFVEGYATSSFNFNAEIVGGTAGFAIWIDWNNDMIFNNATERVFNTTAYANGPFTGLISIPAGTPIGNYRMRITTDWNALNPSNPCAAVARAEFEDYTVSVIAAPACVPPVATVSGVTNVSANLNWAAVPSAVLGYEYVLDNVATDPVVAGTLTSAITYAASGLTPLTTYYFHIRSVCSAGTYSTWSKISFTTIATPPLNDNCSGALVLTPGATFATNPLIATNVGATNSAPTPAPTCGIFAGGDVWYTVTVPASGNITIETQANGASPVNDTQFTVYSGSCGVFTQVGCDDEGGIGSFSLLAITGRPAGEILYVHAYIYDNLQTGTYQISAYDASLSAASFDKSTFVAYPNPVKDVLNLSYKTAISNVSIINLLGQEVLNTKTNSNDVQVNMSALTAGAYIVNIIVDDTVHTIKVIKE